MSSMLLQAVIQLPKFDRIAFRLGPLSIHWYGLAYIAGFVIAYLMLRRMIRQGALRLTSAELSDLITWLILGVLLGGRLGWWIFYHHNIRESEPWYAPIAVWTGGMSFHGGVMGVAIAMILWSRFRRAPFWNIADCAALVTPVGLFLGRMANFINAELVGRPSNVPWAMIFPGDTIARHPSQLYEALLEGPVLLACLWLLRRTRPAEGRIGATFVLLYGLFRFLVEFTREPDPQLGYVAFGWLTMGQILSLALVAVGVLLWQTRRPSGGAPPRAGAPSRSGA